MKGPVMKYLTPDYTSTSPRGDTTRWPDGGPWNEIVTGPQIAIPEKEIDMSVTIQQGEGNVRTLRVEGVLGKPEFDAIIWVEAERWEPELNVRVLVLAQGLKGWEGSEEWGDVSFFMEYGDRIEKIAIVADENGKLISCRSRGSVSGALPLPFLHQTRSQKPGPGLSGNNQLWNDQVLSRRIMDNIMSGMREPGSRVSVLRAVKVTRYL